MVVADTPVTPALKRLLAKQAEYAMEQLRTREREEKRANDEFNARVIKLSETPQVTLYDRIGALPVIGFESMHFIMLKRIAKMTKDSSYDVANYRDVGAIREKLVRFFKSQGMNDTTEHTINRKYAIWQKNNATRLIHQSDIDNPSAALLEFS